MHAGSNREANAGDCDRGTQAFKQPASACRCATMAVASIATPCVAMSLFLHMHMTQALRSTQVYACASRAAELQLQLQGCVHQTWHGATRMRNKLAC